MNNSLLGLIFGLASALIWGGGDFSGGMAARRIHTIQVMAITSFAGLAAMLTLALLTGESWLHGVDYAWAGAAGAIGAVGIVILFYGLSKRAAAIVAPTSAVVGTALPVLVSALTEGLPGATQIAGILVGAMGIWLVSRSPGEITAEMKRLFWLAAASGVCFGTFFIFIAQVSSTSLFVPLTISKASASLTALVLLGLRRLPLPNLRRNPLALLAGLMDTGGNAFYLLAVRYTRIDIAAVLASMGPAITVLLSALFLREKVSKAQGFGVLLCIGATVLLAM
jgi:drug/metabolite transporter (DMT)-like permease